MFGFFKKSIEVKYGRKNYVSNEFEINDNNWILLLSGLLIEAKDMDMGVKKAEHNVLEIYSEGVLNSNEEKELKNDFVLRNISAIKLRMEQVLDLELRTFERDVYYALNSNSLDEVKAIALETRNEDDDEIYRELFEYIWKKRDVFKDTHFRLGFIAHSIWQIRMAVYFKVLHRDVAWTHLKTLANLARPLMTIFSSWEAYHLNLQQFHEVYEYKYPDERLFINRAMISLNKREESPFNKMPYDLGIDKSYPYNITTHTNIFAPHIDAYKEPTFLAFLELLEREDRTKLFEELEKLRKKSEDEFEKVFPFILGKFRPNSEHIDEEDIITLPDEYPNSYAYAMRGNYFYNYAWEARGTGDYQSVGEKNYELFFERLNYALNDWLKSYELDPTNQNVWSDLYEVLSHFKRNPERNAKRVEFYNLMRKEALSNVACVYGISRFKQERWGGSFEENLDWAREVLAGTKSGERTQLIIYDVMLERYESLSWADDGSEERFIKDKKIQSEVNQYFDALVENMHKSPYSISDTLIYWYIKVGDYERLRKVVAHTQAGKFDLTTFNDTYTERYTKTYMQWIRSV